MIITMRAVFVALFVDGHILAESFLTLFADESHLRCPLKCMCLGLCMTFRTVEPLLATWGADGDLGIQDVFAMEGIPWLYRKYLMAWETHHIVFKKTGFARIRRESVRGGVQSLPLQHAE
jgi:hypothetical protein